MNKQEFLKNLRSSLSNLPQEEIEERIIFYCEMIDDRIEEGLSEEEAVAAVSTADETLTQSTNEQPTPTPKTKRKFKSWEIILLILGSPIWFSLLIAAFAVAIAVYASLWAVLVSLWAAFGAVAGSALSCIVVGVGLACTDKVLIGIASIGVGIALAGLSIFFFYGSLAATKGSIFLTKKIFRLIFNKKEASK